MKNGYNSAKTEQKSGTAAGVKNSARRNSAVMLAGDLEYMGKKYLLANPGNVFFFKILVSYFLS
jgi:hypothetical protein